MVQEDMMTEQGLSSILKLKGMIYQDWENVSSQVRLLEQYKDIQNKDLILHYDMSQRWPLGYMMIQTWDLWPGDQGTQDMHTNEFCARIVTKWILIFHH